jgi:hypothetical protein
MKKVLMLGPVLLAAAIAVFTGYGTADVTPAAGGSTLPASLDELFPPQTPAPVFLMAMHDMDAPLSGMVCDVMENDPANAQRNLGRFKAAYRHVPELVPEWADRFPEAPLEGLEAALKSGDQGWFMGALDRLDAVCHDCHVQNMAAVQFKYHWDDFHSIEVTDPLMKQPVSYKQFKHMLDVDLVGIGNDLEQGQIENATMHAQALAARYEAFSELCVLCHDTERKYFVSEDIRSMLAGLATALEKEPVDQAEVGKLIQGIGDESCFKCHLVHAPAAMSKH